jgi:hypothetical protein
MKRQLTGSEKRLLIFCISVITLVGVFFVWRGHRDRLAAARQKIEDYQGRFSAAIAAAGDAPFWQERQKWLDAKMPVMGDAGKAHSSFLEHLQNSARERGLAVASPVLLKHEGGPHHRELPVSLQVTGPDNAVFRWLVDLQSPEKFQLIKYLLLTSSSGKPARMTCNITVSRLFKP